MDLKYKFSVKRKERKDAEPSNRFRAIKIRCSAATGETFGTMTFIFAATINPVLTAPITSFHCLLTIVLARIFLKERLSKKQYISLGFVLLGIVMLGFANIFGL